MEQELTTLRSRENIAEATMAFHFEKPQGFRFKPGQTVDLTLVKPSETDTEGNTRTFSIASAPEEPDIFVATRMRSSAFKRVLATAPLGLPVRIAGPMGSFTLHRNVAKPAVFLAGGIGVTPFRSMILDAIGRHTGHQLTLFYSNDRPEDTAFLGELQQLAAAHASFRFVPTMTEMDRSRHQWSGETGPIGPEMLSRYLESLRGPIYYLAGPPAMVQQFREELGASGVDDDIRGEEFAGY
jgi:ferredoxin-NADP reductase